MKSLEAEDMTLVEKINIISDYCVMPVKVTRLDKNNHVKITIPGKKPVQVKAIVDVLKMKKILRKISATQYNNCVHLVHWT